MFPSEITILIQIQYAEDADVINTNDVLCRFDNEYKYRDAQRTAKAVKYIAHWIQTESVTQSAKAV